MKKHLYIIILALFYVINSNADNNAQVCGIAFGTDYNTTLTQLEKIYGKALTTTDKEITYTNKWYMNKMFRKIVFRFDKDKNNGKTFLNEAKFETNIFSKQTATNNVRKLAKQMGKEYPGVSMDIEEDGSIFYKGGHSPLSFEYLFTIYIVPVRGGYKMELRYGPLHYVK